MVTRFEQFVASISCISRYIQRLERDTMAPYGLKGPHAQYLIVMRRFPEGVTAAQLSGLCEKDKAAVSRAVSELTACGMICHADSMRSYRAPLVLTQQGLEAANTLTNQVEIAVEQAGLGLTEQDRAVFYSALTRISSNLQQLSEQGLPHHEV